MSDQPPAARAAPRIALVTSAELPELDADTRRLLGPLAARGVAAEPVVWDDPTVDWAAFDLAVVRSCWGYVPRRAEFLAWARSVPRLVNPPDVLAWNTDKRYLQDLAGAGVPVVPGGAKRLLYARVDLVPGPHGQPLLMELELTEPQLFLGYAPDAAERLAVAITARTRPLIHRRPAASGFSRNPQQVPSSQEHCVEHGLGKRARR